MIVPEMAEIHRDFTKAVSEPRREAKAPPCGEAGIAKKSLPHFPKMTVLEKWELAAM
jgi:hypothetical protein